MNVILRITLAAVGVALATQASARITVYEHQGFEGRSFATEKRVENFSRYGFNDRASSVEVLHDRWEVCEDVRFDGRCVVLRPGRYPSLAAMGLNNRISSVRAISPDTRIEDHHYAPAPVAVNEYRRRHNERLYEANVTSVHAVLGTPEQRCWVETEQIIEERRRVNVPGAIVGAVIGGILGHQVGGGRGQDIATAGGAVAGAAVGANVGRNSGGQQVSSRDVQRCESVPSQARPDYWEVTYTFRGQVHHMQMSAPPGPTVTVNEQGEPRG
ncbi:MAG: beta/gamma crystallin-related protein [Thiobacillus sp.]|nr:beta/gamma crystallin-related protein [Thiobacillus sp.]